MVEVTLPPPPPPPPPQTKIETTTTSTSLGSRLGFREAVAEEKLETEPEERTGVESQHTLSIEAQERRPAVEAEETLHNQTDEEEGCFITANVHSTDVNLPRAHAVTFEDEKDLTWSFTCGGNRCTCFEVHTNKFGVIGCVLLAALAAGAALGAVYGRPSSDSSVVAGGAASSTSSTFKATPTQPPPPEVSPSVFPSPMASNLTSPLPTTSLLATNLTLPLPTAPLLTPTLLKEVDYCEAATFDASNRSDDHRFGFRVAVSNNTAIVGAYNDKNYWPGAGSVHVYIRAVSAWTYQEKLLPSDDEATTAGWFGRSVSIHGDTIAIGARRKDDRRGIVHVFVLVATMWTEEAKLIPVDGSIDDNFGGAVDVFRDSIVVGAPKDEGGRGGTYVFARTGQTWEQQAKLKPEDGAYTDARFGHSVSIDKDTVLIGARWDDEKGFRSGSAYVFVRAGTEWTQQAKLLAQDGSPSGWFGCSVDVLGDTAIVGAEGGDSQGENSGTAYVFTRTGSDWQQMAKLLPDDGAEYDKFGVSVALLSEDVAIVGAYETDDKGLDSGSAYIFQRTWEGTWKQKVKLLPNDGKIEDQFGIHVAADGGIAIVGTSSHEGGGGKAYVFEEC